MLIPMNRRVNLTSQLNNPRMLYAGDQWVGATQPQVLVQDDSVRIMGDLDKGITVDTDYGTLIQGPCSLAEMPENIRIASYYSLNPMLLCCVGSSAAMNIPTLVAATPPILQAQQSFNSIMGS